MRQDRKTYGFSCIHWNLDCQQLLDICRTLEELGFQLSVAVS
jgi:hypothetical protein